jgi:hypothetical protein
VSEGVYAGLKIRPEAGSKEGGKVKGVQQPITLGISRFDSHRERENHQRSNRQRGNGGMGEGIERDREKGIDGKKMKNKKRGNSVVEKKRRGRVAGEGERERGTFNALN